MTLQKIHSLIINNSLYNLRDQWQRRDGPEVLMVSFETFSIQKLNFCNFAFAWERDDFDRLQNLDIVIESVLEPS